MDIKVDASTEQIMVNGRFSHPHNACLFIEIQRGMSIKACDGEEIGFSAGMLIDRCNNSSTHLLLGRLPTPAEYRFIPVDCIDHVTDNAIHLTINKAAVGKLALHQPTW
ncbi:MAG: DUF2171 domain-containing protein [Anaerolineales bacterium]|nr:DUF2171 domain-containing protein [Anaerolineales bacterium]